MHNLAAGFEFIMHGGFMMYPLLLSALVALTVVIERYMVFRKRFVMPATATSEILTHVKRGDFSAATAFCQKLTAPVADVLKSGIEHFANPMSEMELAMKNQAEEWIPIMEKRMEVIDTVITAAPLMGLLGTITGMMASFQVLSVKGVNEPNAITGGVAEALIATATGLVIALVCLFAYNYLSTKVKFFIYEIESAASRLVEVRLAAERNGKAR